MSAASPGAPSGCSSARTRIAGPRLSSSATVTSTVLRGLPCGLSRYTATAAGVNTATAASPATTSGPGLPCQACPPLGGEHAVSVRGAADKVHSREPRAEPAAWRRQYRCSRTCFGDPAGFQDQHPVGEREHIQQIVGDQHRRTAVAGQHPAQHLAHGGGGGDIQPGQRLVKQQYVGFGGQRAGQGHPLGLPTGQLSRHPVGQVGRIDLGQPMRRCRTGNCAVRTPHSPRHSGVGTAAGPAEQADAAVMGGHVHARRRVGQHPVADVHDAAVRPHQTRRSHVAPSTCPRRWVPELPALRLRRRRIRCPRRDSRQPPEAAHRSWRVTRHWRHRPAAAGCPARPPRPPPPQRARATTRLRRRRRSPVAGRSRAEVCG